MRITRRIQFVLNSDLAIKNKKLVPLDDTSVNNSVCLFLRSDLLRIHVTPDACVTKKLPSTLLQAVTQ